MWNGDDQDVNNCYQGDNACNPHDSVFVDYATMQKFFYESKAKQEETNKKLDNIALKGIVIMHLPLSKMKTYI